MRYLPVLSTVSAYLGMKVIRIEDKEKTSRLTRMDDKPAPVEEGGDPVHPEAVALLPVVVVILRGQARAVHHLQCGTCS